MKVKGHPPPQPQPHYTHTHTHTHTHLFRGETKGSQGCAIFGDVTMGHGLAQGDSLFMGALQSQPQAPQTPAYQGGNRKKQRDCGARVQSLWILRVMLGHPDMLNTHLQPSRRLEPRRGWGSVCPHPLRSPSVSLFPALTISS